MYVNITLNVSQNAYFDDRTEVFTPTQQMDTNNTFDDCLPKAFWYILTAKYQVIRYAIIVQITAGVGLLGSFEIIAMRAYVYRCKAGYAIRPWIPYNFE